MLIHVTSANTSKNMPRNKKAYFILKLILKN